MLTEWQNSVTLVVCIQATWDSIKCLVKILKSMTLRRSNFPFTVENVVYFPCLTTYVIPSVVPVWMSTNCTFTNSFEYGLGISQAARSGCPNQIHSRASNSSTQAYWKDTLHSDFIKICNKYMCSRASLIWTPNVHSRGVSTLVKDTSYAWS